METPVSLMGSEARIPSRAPHDLKTKGDIGFLHPGYGSHAASTLLALARTDCQNSNGAAVFGVHHGTALLACQIIANNAFNSGYFTLDPAGLQRVDVPLHGLLTEKQYFFFIDGIDKYPVVPSFRDWEFPHVDIENIWPTIPSDDLDNRLLCPLSGFTYAINGAHIIPRQEFTWFSKNDMGADINGSDNIIPLRKDLHKCFDDRWFVIIPKPTSNGTRYVTHVLLPDAAEIWPNYHNIELRCLSPNHGRKFLFARFAWAILQQVKPFITAGFKRRVICLNTKDTDKMEYLVSDIEGPQLQELYSGGGSKSATPLKRKFQATSANDYEELSSDDSDMNSNEWWDVELRTPRKRRVQSSSDTVLDSVPTLPEDVKRELETSVADLIASQNLQDVDE